MRVFAFAFMSVSLLAFPARAEYCREYIQDIKIGNKMVQGYGTTCLQPDGSWKARTEPQLPPEYQSRQVQAMTPRGGLYPQPVIVAPPPAQVFIHDPWRGIGYHSPYYRSPYYAHGRHYRSPYWHHHWRHHQRYYPQYGFSHHHGKRSRGSSVSIGWGW